MGIIDIQIHRILKDKSHPYHSKRDDAAHRASVEEMSRLYEQLSQESRPGRTTSWDASDILILPND